MITIGSSIPSLMLPLDPLNEALAASTVAVRTTDSQGTAFFVEPNVLLTAAHVVEGARSVTIVWSPESGRGQSQAQVLVSDESIDVAILEAQHSGTPLPFAPTPAAVGDAAYILGAASEEFQVTVGEIIAVQGPIPEILATAKAYPGASGAPLVNAQSQLVGLVQARELPASETRAISATSLQTFLDSQPRSEIVQPPDIQPNPSTSDGDVPLGLVSISLAIIAVAMIVAMVAVRRKRRKVDIIITSADLD